jgi:hypothetical protein
MALIQCDWCPYKMERDTETDVHTESKKAVW